MSFDFIDPKVQQVEFLKHDEITFFCRYKRFFTKCPECNQNKMKFIRKFEYYDYKLQWLQTTTLRYPVCISCFDSNYYQKIVDQYYRSDKNDN